MSHALSAAVDEQWQESPPAKRKFVPSATISVAPPDNLLPAKRKSVPSATVSPPAKRKSVPSSTISVPPPDVDDMPDWNSIIPDFLDIDFDIDVLDQVPMPLVPTSQGVSPRQSAVLPQSPRQSAVLPQSPRQSAVLPQSPRQSAVLPQSPRQSLAQHPMSPKPMGHAQRKSPLTNMTNMLKYDRINFCPQISHCQVNITFKN